MQVPIIHHILDKVDKHSTGICTGMNVENVVGAAQFKERLSLKAKKKKILKILK